MSSVLDLIFEKRASGRAYRLAAPETVQLRPYKTFLNLALANLSTHDMRFHELLKLAPYTQSHASEVTAATGGTYAHGNAHHKHEHSNCGHTQPTTMQIRHHANIMHPNTATQLATHTHLPHAVSLSRERDPKHAPPMMPRLPEQAFPSASSTAHAWRWAGGMLGIGSGLRLTGALRGRRAHSGRGCSSRRRARRG